MGDDMSLKFAIIDIDNLILDVAALVLALCRSQAQRKVHQSKLADFDNHRFREAAQNVLSSIISEDN